MKNIKTSMAWAIVFGFALFIAREVISSEPKLSWFQKAKASASAAATSAKVSASAAATKAKAAASAAATKANLAAKRATSVAQNAASKAAETAKRAAQSEIANTVKSTVKSAANTAMKTTTEIVKAVAEPVLSQTVEILTQQGVTLLEQTVQNAGMLIEGMASDPSKALQQFAANMGNSVQDSRNILEKNGLEILQNTGIRAGDVINEKLVGGLIAAIEGTVASGVEPVAQTIEMAAVEAAQAVAQAEVPTEHVSGVVKEATDTVHDEINPIISNTVKGEVADAVDAAASEASTAFENILQGTIDQARKVAVNQSTDLLRILGDRVSGLVQAVSRGEDPVVAAQSFSQDIKNVAEVLKQETIQQAQALGQGSLNVLVGTVERKAVDALQSLEADLTQRLQGEVAVTVNAAQEEARVEANLAQVEGQLEAAALMIPVMK